MELTGNYVTKTYKSLLKLFLVFSIAITFFSCSNNLPDEYGVYFYNDKDYIKIKKVKLLKKGNLNNSFQGLKKPSGNEFKVFDKILIFQPKLNPENIKMTALGYMEGGFLRGVISKQYYKVQLWIPDYPIPISIKPLEGNSDMYEVTLESKLNDGFYIIHSGNTGERISSKHYLESDFVCDFVIGDASKYQSYDQMKKSKMDRMNRVSHDLIEQFNKMYNEQNFDSINYVYFPSNKAMTESEKQNFIKESNIWFEKAGKFETFEIKDSIISEFKSTYEINTSYKNIGEQRERFTIELLNGQYYITKIQ
ncbi:MAG: hypothetical protein K8S16_22105 [Bacteroidales bacterium]|nr:hypothetical protein [Bacteroidales bacterium]